MNGDINMCKLLLDNFADFTGAQFGSLPTPLEMAIAMDLTDIVELFNESPQPSESPILSILSKFLVRLHGEYNILVKLCGNTT